MSSLDAFSIHNVLCSSTLFRPQSHVFVPIQPGPARIFTKLCQLKLSLSILVYVFSQPKLGSNKLERVSLQGLQQTYCNQVFTFLRPTNKTTLQSSSLDSPSSHQGRLKALPNAAAVGGIPISLWLEDVVEANTFEMACIFGEMARRWGAELEAKQTAVSRDQICMVALRQRRHNLPTIESVNHESSKSGILLEALLQGNLKKTEGISETTTTSRFDGTRHPNTKLNAEAERLSQTKSISPRNMEGIITKRAESTSPTALFGANWWGCLVGDAVTLAWGGREVKQQFPPPIVAPAQHKVKQLMVEPNHPHWRISKLCLLKEYARVIWDGREVKQKVLKEFKIRRYLVTRPTSSFHQPTMSSDQSSKLIIMYIKVKKYHIGREIGYLGEIDN
ncbi:hypothetical protein C8J56DRAFT_1034904 [Mycena floridula]|nr:hypothetical protein C8J56DRAFT_1034904 [Mycena floridula]